MDDVDIFLGPQVPHILPLDHASLTSVAGGVAVMRRMIG